MPRHASSLPLAFAATAVLMLTMGGTLGGCSSTNIARLRANPSPELHTVGRTEDQVNNHAAITNDKLFRSAYEDLLRGMLITDRRIPSYTPTP